MFSVRQIGEAPPVDRPVAVREPDGAERIWRVPVETPVAIIYNERNYAVMMTTPADLADYAVGFSLTEQIIRRVEDIKEIDIIWSQTGADLRIRLSGESVARLDIRDERRRIIGATSCGLCGVENDLSLFDIPSVDAAGAAAPAFESVHRAFDDLPNHQKQNARTRTVHAAAFADSEGKILLCREDVGRHNALDKLVGALNLGGRTSAGGFVVMSSRCSFEIIQKAARAGLGAVASLSGPTTLALEKARDAGIALFGRSAGVVVRLDI